MKNPMNRRSFLKSAGIMLAAPAVAIVAAPYTPWWHKLIERVKPALSPVKKENRVWGEDFNSVATQRQILETGKYGHIYSTDIHVSGISNGTPIADALNTVEGRTILAQALTEPIKTSLAYQSIGRKLMCVDELPSGALMDRSHG